MAVKKDKITIVCRCGKEFLVAPSGLKRRRNCSCRCADEAKIGKQAWNKGKKLDVHPWNWLGEKKCEVCGVEITRKRKFTRCLKCAAKLRTGSNHPRWIEDRNAAIEKHRIRSTSEWRDWRVAVFGRDNYQCQECGAAGVYLEPHHIIPIRSDWNKLFELTNGITLCRPCHKKTMGKESDFIEKYSLLVAAQG